MPLNILRGWANQALIAFQEPGRPPRTAETCPSPLTSFSDFCLGQVSRSTKQQYRALSSSYRHSTLQTNNAIGSAHLISQTRIPACSARTRDYPPQRFE